MLVSPSSYAMSPEDKGCGPMSAPRLLVVVAHPDDETFGCGSLILHAVSRGWQVDVCCATRGEAGEPDPASGISIEELPAARESELRAAARVLGVDQVTVLDHRDSGMTGDPAPGALVDTPVHDLATEIGGEIARYGPQLVVTLDGSDGHRDHLHVRDATIGAIERATRQETRLYLHCLPRSLLRRWADHRRTIDPGSPYLDVDEADLGTPDACITTTIDTSRFVDRRWQAIFCHRSQRSPFHDLPTDLAHAFLATDHLQQYWPSPQPGQDGADPFDQPRRG